MIFMPEPLSLDRYRRYTICFIISDENTMAPTNKTQKLSREEILQKKREAEKARLSRIRNDPVKLAEYKEKERLRYLKKKEKGQRKSIKDMTPREQRITRKNWKGYAKDYRRKQLLNRNMDDFIRQNSPPSTGDEAEDLAIHVNRPAADCIENQRALEAKRRSLRQRKRRNKQIKKMNDVIAKLKTKLNSQRQKYKRVKQQLKKVVKSAEKTPKTRIEAMSEDVTKKRELVKKALFGEVMKMQLEENFAKTRNYKDKAEFRKVISGKVVDKYKIWTIKNKAVTYKKTRPQLDKKKRNLKLKMQSLVQEFFEDDANSRLAAGKKEFITRKQVKKQKRYLNDSLLKLHKKFLKTTPLIISYSLFSRLRPFWVVPPTLSNRETCTCTYHENMDLKIAALRTANILAVHNHQSLLEELCCNRYAERCLQRICDDCGQRSLTYKEYDNSKSIVLKQWVSKKEPIMDIKTKKETFVTKCKIESQEVKPEELIAKIERDIVKFFQHEFNIIHQYSAIKHLKKSLTENDALVHMDFSENFCTKYNQEIQTFHFGGSRTQISLHTVVVYLKDSVTSHCTMASNLSHNVGAIWAHLKPILTALPPNIQHIHFLSDGPVTQYRNRSMFYMLGCELTKRYPNIITFTWNYHEAGHGKGAPDGVGATCKRTADQVIARGGDVTDLKDFAAVVRERCPSIQVNVIDECEIDSMNALIETNSHKSVAFKGTLSVHQVTGSAFLPNQLVMKSLSCFCDSQVCEHFKLGSVKYKSDVIDTPLNISAIFTDSEDNDLPLSTFLRSKEMNEKPGVSDILKAQLHTSYNQGDYVLVKYATPKTEYRYAGICSYVDEEEGELRVTFLQLANTAGTLFKLDENDISDVSVEQVIKKLPVPSLIMKGKRVFYKFNEEIDVFEK